MKKSCFFTWHCLCITDKSRNFVMSKINNNNLKTFERMKTYLFISLYSLVLAAFILGIICTICDGSLFLTLLLLLCCGVYIRAGIMTIEEN